MHIETLDTLPEKLDEHRCTLKHSYDVYHMQTENLNKRMSYVTNVLKKNSATNCENYSEVKLL